MKPNSGKAERIVRFALGLLIAAIGAFTLYASPWVGAFIAAVGIFTLYEGITGWSFLRAFWGTSDVG